MGVPVVAWESGGIGEWHPGPGLVRWGDVEALAGALENALYDPSSVEVGRAGAELARRESDPAVHMGRLLDDVENGRVPDQPRGPAA